MNREPPKVRYAGYDSSEKDICDETVLQMFRSGLDTKEIAYRFHNRSEASVYNALSQAREKARRG